MIPFYIYYSMFGFQRVGDLVWAAGDSRTRGFLLGGTAGRTTLNGEGLQHEDGHSHCCSRSCPTAAPTTRPYAYELAVIIQDGLRRMLDEQEDVFYYLTLMNENYAPPGDAGGRRGGDPARDVPAARGVEALARSPCVQLLGSGTILREVMAAAELLADGLRRARRRVERHRRSSELRRDGIDAERWNMLHPAEKPRAVVCERAARRPTRPGDRRRPTTSARPGPDPPVGAGGAATATLGTDGYGRSDFRAALRALLRGRPPLRAVAALKELADDGTIDPSVVAQAIEKYEIDADAPTPTPSREPVSATARAGRRS